MAEVMRAMPAREMLKLLEGFLRQHPVDNEDIQSQGAGDEHGSSGGVDVDIRGGEAIQKGLFEDIRKCHGYPPVCAGRIFCTGSIWNRLYAGVFPDLSSGR